MATRAQALAAGASHSATIDFTIHTNAEETKHLEEQIKAIQGDVKPVLDETPEKKE